MIAIITMEMEVETEMEMTRIKIRTAASRGLGKMGCGSVGRISSKRDRNDSFHVYPFNFHESLFSLYLVWIFSATSFLGGGGGFFFVACSLHKSQN